MGLICVEKESTESATRHKDRLGQLYVFERDEERKRRMRVVQDFHASMYTLDYNVDLEKYDEENGTNLYQGVARIEAGYKTIYGQACSKVVFGLGANPVKIKSYFDSMLQSDVQFPSVYITETEPKIDMNPRICAFDIEVNSSKTFPSADYAKYQVIAISIYDSYLQKLIWMTWRPDLEQKIDRTTYHLDEEGYKQDYPYDRYLFKDEKTMLLWFIKYIRQADPDILTGWNIKRFDIKYIIRRMKRLGIDYTRLSPLKRVKFDNFGEPIIDGRVILDGLASYKKLQLAELDSYKLEEVAQHVLGFGKVKHVVSIGELWKQNFKVFEEYSVLDSLLVWLIFQHEDILGFVLTIADQCKSQIYHTLYNKDIVDSYLRTWCKDKYVLPTINKRDREGYKGAITREPKRGLKGWTIGLDEESLYPSIMDSCNMSPETIITPDHPDFNKVPKICIHDVEIGTKKTGIRKIDVYFRQDIRGIVPMILRELKQDRKKYVEMRDSYDALSEDYQKYNRLQFAVKTIMNSFYGVLGYPVFRLYDTRVAAAVTKVGRDAMEHMASIAKSFGYEVAYGDTDSIFVELLNDKLTLNEVIEIGKKLQDAINPTYDDFVHKYDDTGSITEHKFKLKFEKVYQRILFVGDEDKGVKKNYAGILLWIKGKKTRKIDIVGFGAIKSDNSKFSRDIQKTVLEMILGGQKKQKVYHYLRRVIDDVNQNTIDWYDLAIPQAIKKPLHLYKGGAANHAHIRGAKYSNQWLGTSFGAGTKPRRLYVKSTPPHYAKTDVIDIDDETIIPPGFVVDHSKMIESTIELKLHRIFDAVNWKWSELRTGKAQMDLQDFITT